MDPLVRGICAGIYFENIPCFHYRDVCTGIDIFNELPGPRFYDKLLVF